MNGKRAKLLRKLSNFNPSNEREYSTFKSAIKKQRVFTIGQDGSVTQNIREIDRFQNLCESDSRLRYKSLKKAWKSFIEDEAIHLSAAQIKKAVEILEKQQTSKTKEEETDGNSNTK